MSGTLSGSSYYVGSGLGNSGSDSGTTITSGGDEYVGFDFGGGSVTSATVDSAGYLYVGYQHGTGTATSTTINYAGNEVVGGSSGTGEADDTIVNSGGAQYVGLAHGTGTATDTTINHGEQFVGDNSGTGTATYTTIGYLGVQEVGSLGGTGTAIDTTILAYGEQFVGDDGTGYATSTTIDSSGEQFVGYYPYAVGTATDTTIGGVQYDGFGGTGTAISQTIASGGVQYVGYEAGTGFATSTTIDGGGTQFVGDAGYGGAHGTASSTTILSGGVQLVGGQSGGFGAAISTTIDSGGSQFVGVFSGMGSADDTMIMSRGTQLVGYLSGTGTATNTTIGAGATQVLGSSSGIGSTTGTTILSGGQQYDGYFYGTGSATNTTISGGTQYVGDDEAVGMASNTTIGANGVQYVGDYFATGTAISTTIDSGGSQYVGYGLYGTGTATDTTIFAGGAQYLGGNELQHAIATSTTLSGGQQVVSSGGTATDTTILVGGSANILSAGVANSPIIDGGMLQLNPGGSIGGGDIDFASPTGANGGTLNLQLEGTGFTLSTAISGFAGAGDSGALSDLITVAGSGETGDKAVWTQTGGDGTLKVETSGGAVLDTMTLDGTYNPTWFALSENGSADTIAYAPCYLRGTRILTSRGEVEVERLSVGDVVVTASGAEKPIRWLGRRAIDCRRHPNPMSIWPIRVAAGAFGENAPARDLWLSPGHHIAWDGELMRVAALQNGKSVAQHVCDVVEYWHVELDEHDILLAEGLPAESYLDTGNRTAFANGGAFVEAHPDFEPKHWAETCLPLAHEGPSIVRAKEALLARLRAMGEATTSEDDRHVLADGARIEPMDLGEGSFAFAIPDGATDIRLMSRTFVPAHVYAGSLDYRTLGLCVKRLQINQKEIALDDPRLDDAGWWDLEQAPDRSMQRWTKGEAVMPAGTRLIVVELATTGVYWRQPPSGEADQLKRA